MDEKDIKLSGILNNADSDKSTDNSKENGIDSLDISFKNVKKEKNENTYNDSALDEKVTDLVNEKKNEENKQQEFENNIEKEKDEIESEIIGSSETADEDCNDEKTEKELSMISKMGLDDLKAEEIKIDDDKDIKKDLIGSSPVHSREVKPKKSPVSATPTVKKSSNNKSSKSKGKKKKSRINNSIFGGIIIITVILTVSILLAAGGISVGMEYWGIGKSDNDISFNIPKGASNDDIADLLVENGIIKNKTLFKIALKLGNPEAIYPGDITLQPSQGY